MDIDTLVVVVVMLLSPQSVQGKEPPVKNRFEQAFKEADRKVDRCQWDSIFRKVSEEAARSATERTKGQLDIILKRKNNEKEFQSKS